MRAAAHDPDFAKKVGVPQPVAKEFMKADKRKRGRDLTPRARKDES
jgi:hypothetical protein